MQHKNPQIAEAIRLQEQGKDIEAIKLYQSILTENPEQSEVWNNLGVIYINNGQSQQAENYLKQAINYDPNNISALQNLGLLYLHHQHHNAAIECFQQILTNQPNHYHTLLNLAQTYMNNHQEEDSLNTYLQALDCEEADVKAYIQYYEVVLASGNEEFWKNTNLTATINTALEQCNWDKVDHKRQQAMKLVKQCHDQNLPPLIDPYTGLMLNFPGDLQLMLTKLYANNQFKNIPQSSKEFHFTFSKQPKDKLRIGYISGNFRNHPSTHSLTHTLELHDRDNFEIYLYAINKSDNSPERKRIEQAADVFRDVYEQSWQETAKTIYDDNIDILVSIMGYTAVTRNEACAVKPAPVQIHYLTYNGTMATDFIDYYITDRTAIPKKEEKYYTEKLILMPDCFLPKEGNPITADIPTKKECNLPEDKIILAALHRSTKIDRLTCQTWAEILTTTDNTVLWLLDNGNEINNILIEKLQTFGVKDTSRILIAPNVPKPNHLARLSLADLYIDCFQTNAHTTSIDALYASVPVITLEGETLFSRVSASILKAANLSHLITQTTQDYKEKILQYCNNPDQLANLKTQVKESQSSSPLFDCKKYTTDLEKAYQEAYQRFIDGKKPDHIEV